MLWESSSVIGRWLETHIINSRAMAGDVVQLTEQFPSRQEARGSIPTTSKEK